MEEGEDYVFKQIPIGKERRKVNDLLVQKSDYETAHVTTQLFFPFSLVNDILLSSLLFFLN